MTKISSFSIILESMDTASRADSEQFKIFFRFLLDQLSQGNRLHLYSLFSKIAYLDGLLEFTDSERQAMHSCRKYIESSKIEFEEQTVAGFRFAIKRLMSLTAEGKECDIQYAEELKNWNSFGQSQVATIENRPLIRAAVVAVDTKKKELHIANEEDGVRLIAKYGIPEINEQFNSNIQQLDKRIKLPVMVHFIENRFIDNKTFYPSAVVIDPDFLVDVTAIAESFTHAYEVPLIFVMRQFMPKTTSTHLLIGNMANMILDRLMLGKSVNYSELMQEMFQHFALDFSLLNDEQVHGIAIQAKQLIQHLFHDVKILKSENKDAIAYIEPTFISPKYGIQGRLDTLFLDKNFKSGQIVELKSGKPYKENEFGLNRNHYIQTLLYDMAVKSAFGEGFKSVNHILYCKLKRDRLKQAPTIKSIGYDALRVRNDLVSIQHHFMTNRTADSIAFRFDHPIFNQVGGFLLRDAKFLQNVTSLLNQLECKHFTHFCSLISSENYMSKVGGELTRNGMGFAALWRSDAQSKESNFNILRGLKIVERLDEGQYSFLLSEENSLSNFRRGDIVVVYPTSRESNPVGGQLLKGSILKITPTHVEIRLRNPLIQAEVFESIEDWNAEHDFIESSTRHAYRSLFAFYEMTPRYRRIFMGIIAPEPTKQEIDIPKSLNLTKHQANILEGMLCAENYYLLWGPPGTGKTSVMLKAYVSYLMENTVESLLLIAYTNRAVDEMCGVLDAHYKDRYIRIGSSFSVPIEMKSTLLQSRVKHVKSRKELRAQIADTRIFIGTVASVSGKEELFALKHFDRMVVDEASQILEPHLLGLFSKIKRTVLIGDHKQLPAVVTSAAAVTKIEDKSLRQIGYQDTAMSLFERLYRRCIDQQWNHVLGRLSKQGRMHETINHFVSQHFYKNELEIVTHVPDLQKRLTGSLQDFYINMPVLDDRKLSQRIEFVNVGNEQLTGFEIGKMSEAEAEKVDQLCAILLPCLANERTIGIICPFRAQIALIKSKIEQRHGQLPAQISIDTVERYQGGARDVILLSTCAMNRRTFDAIRSLDQDGVDRKLNVALSRAREQIIVIGDRSVLESDKCYSDLIQYSESLPIKLI